MRWLLNNWIFVVFFIGMVAMHRRHGGGHRGRRGSHRDRHVRRHAPDPNTIQQPVDRIGDESRSPIATDSSDAPVATPDADPARPRRHGC